jgi:hypothetical protein
MSSDNFSRLMASPLTLFAVVTTRKRLERFMCKEDALRVDVVPRMLLLGFALS